MKLADKKDIKRIHTLLASIGMANDKEYKQSLVKQYTNDRETSTTKLSVDEAGKLIEGLQQLTRLTPEQVKADEKRKRIIHYAHEMMWYKSESGDRRAESGRPKVDMDRVNGWCVEYGYLHKPLNDYTLAELSKLIWQIQQVHKDFLKAV